MRRRFAAIAAIAVMSALAAAPVASADPPLRSVMFVGHNWDATADVVTAKTFQVLHRINIIPDKQERPAEIYTSPDKLAYYLLIQQEIGEGHDQYVDDMFSTPDGKRIAV